MITSHPAFRSARRRRAALNALLDREPVPLMAPVLGGRYRVLVHHSTRKPGWWQATFFEGEEPIGDSEAADWPALLEHIHMDSVDWRHARPVTTASFTENTADAIAPDEGPATLYHVTYLYNLPSIQKHGLVPGSGQVFAGGYAGHSTGKLFLTDLDGVSFWVSRYGEMAEHHTVHPEEGWLPVVLEISDTSDLTLHVDAPGSKDSSAGAFYTEQIVMPDELLVWDGDDWESVDDADEDKMLQRALDAAEVEDPDPDDELERPLYYMDYDVFMPPDDN